MRIKAEQVEAVEFKSSVRGYDRDQVDAFLDEVAAGVRSYEDEVDRLKAQVDRLRIELAGATARAEHRSAEQEANINRAIDATINQALADDDGW